MGFKAVKSDCLRGGCERWEYAKDRDDPVYLADCERCGFNVKEAARRRQIPLTLCEDGLQRKILTRKETEVSNDA